MAVEYTLLMQKMDAESAVFSSFDHFGFAVSEIEWPDLETKEVATRDWPEDHGEDAYISPDGLKYKAFDLEVELLYKGDVDTAYPKFKQLRDYLTGETNGGARIEIYDPYWKIGRRRVYVKKIGDLKPHRTNSDEALGAKVTFRVTDPKTETVLSYVGN